MDGVLETLNNFVGGFFLLTYAFLGIGEYDEFSKDLLPNLNSADVA